MNKGPVRRYDLLCVAMLSGIETEKLEKMPEHMSWTGILEYHWEDPDGKSLNYEKRWETFDEGCAGDFHDWCAPSAILSVPEGRDERDVS